VPIALQMDQIVTLDVQIFGAPCGVQIVDPNGPHPEAVDRSNAFHQMRSKAFDSRGCGRLKSGFLHEV